MKGSITRVAEPLTLDVAGILSRHDPAHRIQDYHTALMRENAVVNLVSRETTEADFLKLCAESLLPFETEAVAQKSFSGYLDIGSGGGMPAIPILLTGKASGKAFLYERTIKKAAALERMLATLGLNAQVLAQSFGEIRRRDRFSLITLRYVSLTDKLLREMLALLELDGLLVYYGRPENISVPSEITIYPYLVPPDTAARHFTLLRQK